jgi:hypothetical protein
MMLPILAGTVIVILIVALLVVLVEGACGTLGDSSLVWEVLLLGGIIIFSEVMFGIVTGQIKIGIN